MTNGLAKAMSRKLALLMIGVCFAFSSAPSQATPIRVAPLDPGARPLIETVQASSRPRRARRGGGGGDGAGAALMLGAVALGVGAIVASRQRDREERRARRYYEQQYYPVHRYYEPEYVREPVYQPYPVYRETYAPAPVYRAPRYVRHPAPVYHYAPGRGHHIHGLRPYGGQTARRERHEARQRYWSR